MLMITVPEQDVFDESTAEFYTLPQYILVLEHSLVSLSKWESEFEKPFLAPPKPGEKRTDEETLGYIRAMCLVPDIPPEVYQRLTAENLDEVNTYIAKNMTATWFNEPKAAAGSRGRETVTAELLYYWMITMNIPFECQYWHLNRLLTLIKVVNAKNAPEKKTTKKTSAQMAAERRALNESRRKQLGTRG